MYGSQFVDDRLPVDGREVNVEGAEQPAVVVQDGMVLFGGDGKKVMVTQLQLEDGRVIPAGRWGREEKVEKLELTTEEEQLRETIRVSHSHHTLTSSR